MKYMQVSAMRPQKRVFRGMRLLFVLLFLWSNAESQHKAGAGPFRMSMDASGRIVSLVDSRSGREYVPAGQAGYLLQVEIGGQVLAPTSARYERGAILLGFADGRTARVEELARPDYLRFRITAISEGIDAVIWGPINTTITDTIGGTVGVVRSKDWAIGIQGLNTKTSGGELQNEEGAVFDNGSTALARPFGSSLQAFTVDRSKPRKIKVWNHWPDVPVEAIPEGGLKGSSIALFACAPGSVIPTIHAITIAEHLPEAKWAGEWIKTSSAPGRPYMITTFTEQNVDSFLTLAKRMGMAGVYHEDPFETWGHFVLRKEYFPHGRPGFKVCVQKAHAMGLRLGFHVLSNFITTNDSFVTPKPNPGLASAGTDRLVDALSDTSTELTVKDLSCFRLRSDLNTVMIGDELIRYMEVSPSMPWRLTGCVRGAFGTTASAHAAGSVVNRLIDHPYKVLFPGWKLQQEMAGNIVRFINETGADQMDFDGHEGTYATGMGDYSFNSFAEQVFSGANHSVVFGSSRANHYFWHFNDYLNWGEPWYGGFRESQSDQRIANQKFYETNYLPNMLGWFLITSHTTPADIDWMLARAAGFHAGYALVVRSEALSNPHMDEIVAHIDAWTQASDKGLFTKEQRDWLRDPAHDVELVKDGDWKLQRFKKFEFSYEARILQPGQPTYQNYPFDNAEDRQFPQLILTAEGEQGSLANPVIELDNSYRLSVPVRLTAGESLVLADAGEADVYDKKGRMVRKIRTESRLPALSNGHHELSFDAGMDPNTGLKARIVLKIPEKKENL